MSAEPLEQLLGRRPFNRDDIIRLLALRDDGDVKMLRDAAFAFTTSTLGESVYYRGIVEFSNLCALDCHYCGIRSGNVDVDRYWLTEEEVVDNALWCARAGYGSVVLQAGERSDPPFVDFVERCLVRIKNESRSEALPDGVGITLSVGVQTGEVYRRFHEAGAHRYLLRIETSNREIFRRLHPAEQTFEERVQALRDIRGAGFQVGTGVMIGIPGQSVADLADDILFFKALDVDMIGMGPYIVSQGGAMAEQGMMEKEGLLQLACNMIAVTRLVLEDVNIASTTALQALVPNGRELGISYGANVTMPNLTPKEVRKNYQLYEGKPCIDEGRADCRSCLQRRVESVGRVVGWNEWGDARHYARRQQTPGNARK